MAVTTDVGTLGADPKVITLPAGSDTDTCWLFVVSMGGFNGATFDPAVTLDTPSGWTLELLEGPVSVPPGPPSDPSDANLHVFSLAEVGTDTDVTLDFSAVPRGVYLIVRADRPLLNVEAFTTPDEAFFTKDFGQTSSGSDLVLVQWFGDLDGTSAGGTTNTSTEWTLIDGVGDSNGAAWGRAQLQADYASVDPPETTWSFAGSGGSPQPVIWFWTFLEFGTAGGWHVGKAGWGGSSW